MYFKIKISAVGLAAIIACFGVFATTNTAHAQTGSPAAASMSLDQLQQIIYGLISQIQQIVALIAQLKPLETCGNGICRFGETAANCAADCENNAVCAASLTGSACSAAGGSMGSRKAHAESNQSVAYCDCPNERTKCLADSDCQIGQCGSNCVNGDWAKLQFPVVCPDIWTNPSLGCVCQNGKCKKNISADKKTNASACSVGDECQSGVCSYGNCCDAGQCGWGDQFFERQCVPAGEIRANSWAKLVCRDGVWKTVLNGWGCGDPDWPCDQGECKVVNGTGYCRNCIVAAGEPASCAADADCASGKTCKNNICCLSTECGWGDGTNFTRKCVAGGEIRTNSWAKIVCRDGVWKTVLNGWGCGLFACDSASCVNINSHNYCADSFPMPKSGSDSQIDASACAANN